MIDAGVTEQQSLEILKRRDELLRALASKFPESALKVSEYIRRSVTSAEELEIACVDGFRVLGFEAVHLGKKGKPDGLAIAPLGMREGISNGYRVSIDAKSTEDEGKVSSGNIGFATVKRHRKEHKADFAVVVAPDYQVSEGEESKAVKEAIEENVCLLRANDFADLVLGSVTRPIPLDTLRELFKLHSPDETSRWIKAFNNQTFKVPPIALILETTWKIQQDDKHDSPKLMAIRYKEPKLMDYGSDELGTWLTSISRLVPQLVVVTGDKIQLNQSPENIISQCAAILKKLPAEIMTKPTLDALQNR
jgi:hypothetical protein